MAKNPELRPGADARAIASARVTLGLIGPAGNARPELERALELLMADPAMHRIVYLGADGAIEEVAAARSRSGLEREEFLDLAAELSCSGSADEITELLAAEREGKRLSMIRKLPEPPARAVEMMDKWIVLAVHDKAVLDEDDIANAHIIVYGRADEAGLKRFGPRCFFTPGPLSAGKLGCLELMADGQAQIRLLGLDGETLVCESLQGTSAKLVITS
jgi:hypothetical protein